MENKKLYQCSFCDKSFFTEQERKNHEKICGTVGEKRFNEIMKFCPYCIKITLGHKKIKMKLVEIPNFPSRWVCPECKFEEIY